jgi:mRNA interferase MazF
MSRAAPEAGDLVWTEQRGARPALVISSTAFNQAGHRSIVCPITRNASEWPTKVPLPPACGVEGFVLADQVRSVDRSQRGFRKVGQAPPETVDAVRRKLNGLLSSK